MENEGFIKQILLAGSLEGSNEKGLFVSPFSGSSIAAPLLFSIFHSFPGRREGFRSCSSESELLTCKWAGYVFFMDSGDLPETQVHWARVNEGD